MSRKTEQYFWISRKWNHVLLVTRWPVYPVSSRAGSVIRLSLGRRSLNLFLPVAQGANALTNAVVGGRFLAVVCLIIAPAFSFNCFSSQSSWLHSLAVQMCGSGFWGAASSTHGLVSGTGMSPNFPYLCICGSSGWASVMVRPLKAGNYLKIGNWYVFVLFGCRFVFGVIMRWEGRESF